MADDKKQGEGKTAFMPSPSGEFGHSALISTINQPIALHYREQIKRHGVNPIYAVRLALGISVRDISKRLNMDEETYIDHEKLANNQSYSDTEFVFDFCTTLKISPMDLLPQSGVPSFALYGTMIRIIENPHLVGLCEDVDEDDLLGLHDFVYRLASPEMSVNVLKNRAYPKHRHSKQKYIRELCRDLLRLDGSFRLKSLDMVEDVIEDFTSDKKSEQESLANMIADQQAVVDDMAKDVHALGWKLFPKTNDDDAQWKAVYWAIHMAKINLCDDDIDKTMALYCESDARIIGREEWPSPQSTTTVKYNGRTYDWTTARHMHAEKIKVYYTDFVQLNFMNHRFNTNESRMEMLEISDGVLDAAIRHFQYRQIAMHSMDVRSVVNEDLRMKRVNNDGLLPPIMQQLLMK